MLEFYICFILSIIYFSILIYFVNKFIVSMKLNNINMYSFSLYYDIGIFSLIGSIVLFTNSINTPFSQYIHNAGGFAFFSFLWSFFLFYVYTFFLIKVFGNINIAKLRYLVQLNLSKKEIRFVKFLFIVQIILFLYIITNLQFIPVLELFQGNLKEAAYWRVHSQLNFQGILFIYNVFAKYFIPIVFLIIYYVYLKYKKIKYIFYGSMIITFFYALHNIEKANILNILIVMILINIYIRGFKLKYIIYAFVIFVGAVILYGFTKSFGFSDINYLLYRVLNRIFISQIAGMYLSFEWIPDIIDKNFVYQGLPHIILKIFDLPDFNSAREIMLILEPNSKTVGVMNSYYIGGAWASYNLLGLVVGPFVVALNFYLFHKIIFKIPSKYKVIVIPMYFYFSTRFSYTGDYRNFAYLILIEVTIIILLFLIAIFNIFSKKYIWRRQYEQISTH